MPLPLVQQPPCWPGGSWEGALVAAAARAAPAAAGLTCQGMLLADLLPGRLRCQVGRLHDC